jgi:hypothetical protein
MVQEEEEVISAHRKEVEDTMEIVREVIMILTYSPELLQISRLAKDTYIPFSHWCWQTKFALTVG